MVIINTSSLILEKMVLEMENYGQKQILFSKNKNPLVGVYTIKNEIRMENFQPVDTTVWRENDKTSIWFSIFSDNYRTTFFQQIRLDSLGNDIWNGSGLLVKYEYDNNTLMEKFDFGTKQPQGLLEVVIQSESLN